MSCNVHRAHDVDCMQPARMLHRGRIGAEAPKAVLTTRSARCTRTPAHMRSGGYSSRRPMATTSASWSVS
eukprot:1179536-Lingulodinium_polyedra.AAC.1